MLRATSGTETEPMLDSEVSTASTDPSHRARRRELIAHLAGEREMRQAEHRLRTQTMRLLQIEIEALLELVHIELQMRKLTPLVAQHNTGVHTSLLLATLLSVRRFLMRQRRELDSRARRTADHLMLLESQIDALTVTLGGSPANPSE